MLQILRQSCLFIIDERNYWETVFITVHQQLLGRHTSSYLRSPRNSFQTHLPCLSLFGTCLSMRGTLSTPCHTFPASSHSSRRLTTYLKNSNAYIFIIEADPTTDILSFQRIPLLTHNAHTSCWRAGGKFFKRAEFISIFSISMTSLI